MNADRQPMNTLPQNARFVGADHREYVITTPASAHPDGWVVVIDVHGGGSGFFAAGQASAHVEVVYLPETAR